MNKKAFTILEILVVISVIAILIAIAVPRFKGMQDAAREIQVKSDLRTLQAAVESYMVFTNGTPPNTLDDLVAANPKIVSSIPHDQFNPDQEYTYFVSGKYYVIFSVGPGRNLSTDCFNPDSGWVCPTNPEQAPTVFSTGLGVTNGKFTCDSC
ncbi:MAG: type II secretion system protein [Candidatus Omnitrophota bacterium]